MIASGPSAVLWKASTLSLLMGQISVVQLEHY